MFNQTVVELARWQFALSAMLHFLFIPLLLGLGLLLAGLETAYAVWRRKLVMAQIEFWRPLFALVFILAMTTRLVVLFQFGSNASYFSAYIGDLFALPLALEAIGSFFIAATLFAPYWFGHQRLGMAARLTLIWLLVLSSHFSTFCIMAAHGWMQNPLGAEFSAEAYRWQLSDAGALLHNPILAGKFLHSLAACHAAAAAGILAIAGWRLRAQATDPVARASFNIAAFWGLLAVFATIAIKEPTPHSGNPQQMAKLAAISASANPALLPSIENHIRNGIEAYRALLELRDDKREPPILARFTEHRADLGYVWLLMPFNKKIVDADGKQINLAAQAALPGHPQLLFVANQLMIACGLIALLGFAIAAWRALQPAPLPGWLTVAAGYLASAPWLACLAGWWVSEAGKQPWAIAGLLPISASISTLTSKELILQSLAYLVVYSGLLLLAGQLFKRHMATAGGEQ